MNDTVTRWLVVFLAVVLLQRLFELLLSVRNARKVKPLGAREYGAGHFPLFVIVHTIYIAGLFLEVRLLDARPDNLWPMWLGVWSAAQALRYAAIRALGDRWNVRVIVIPGAPLVRSGPYRYLRHPNYLAVVAELLAAPLIFGAWRTALVVSILNALVLRLRITAENAALGYTRTP